MILRDTSIREPNLPSKDGSSFFRNSLAMYGSGNSTGLAGTTTTTHQLPTTMIGGRDCSSPYGGFQQPTSDVTMPSYLAGTLGSRENNSTPTSSVLRESTNRIAAAHRFMAGGIDQRIMKQSTEDCRRLLQQVGLAV